LNQESFWSLNEELELSQEAAAETEEAQKLEESAPIQLQVEENP
jgi:hypothetical protein